jgi:hypothetical protein
MTFDTPSLVPKRRLAPFDFVEIALAHSADGKPLIGRGIVIDIGDRDGMAVAAVLLFRGPVQQQVRPIQAVVQVPDPRDLSGRSAVAATAPAMVEQWNIEEHKHDAGLHNDGAWRYYTERAAIH